MIIDHLSCYIFWQLQQKVAFKSTAKRKKEKNKKQTRKSALFSNVWIFLQFWIQIWKIVKYPIPFSLASPHSLELCKKNCLPGYSIHGQNWECCSCDERICSHDISSPEAGRKPRWASKLSCVYLDQTWGLEQLSFTSAVLSSLRAHSSWLWSWSQTPSL